MPGSKDFARKANEHYEKKSHQAMIAEMSENEIFEYKKQLIQRFPKAGDKSSDELVAEAMEGIRLSGDIELDELEEEEMEKKKVEIDAAGDVRMEDT